MVTRIWPEAGKPAVLATLMVPVGSATPLEPAATVVWPTAVVLPWISSVAPALGPLMTCSE